MPVLLKDTNMDEKTRQLTAKMHKAITVIQFKEEARIFHRRPEWQMEDRCLLEHIDFADGTCTIDGKKYEMKSCHFPTISLSTMNFSLSDEEADLMKKLHHSFRVSEKLRKHLRTLLGHGSMYAVCNQNLLFHASIPLNDDGSLKSVRIMDKDYCGRELLEYIDQLIRVSFQSDTPADLRAYAKDFFLYLWCGKDSPLFDKSKMATFERYFLTDRDTYHEEKGNYFKLRDSQEVCDRILDAFGVQPIGNASEGCSTGVSSRHIINGHVPVHAGSGENPIKAGGRLMVIDGGFSEAYHKETGIAGYTLIYHSRGFQLVQHEPFTSTQDAINRGTDIKSTTQIVEMSTHRMLVADTDKGAELREQIRDLKQLLHAYRHGIIKEKRN
jgi:fructose-1,6-bisphosphatase-3